MNRRYSTLVYSDNGGRGRIRESNTTNIFRMDAEDHNGPSAEKSVRPREQKGIIIVFY